MKKQYKTNVQQDDQISEQLKTKEGRELYWHSLVEQSRNYDLIDLLLKSIVFRRRYNRVWCLAWTHDKKNGGSS